MLLDNRRASCFGSRIHSFAVGMGCVMGLLDRRERKKGNAGLVWRQVKVHIDKSDPLVPSSLHLLKFWLIITWNLQPARKRVPAPRPQTANSIIRPLRETCIGASVGAFGRFYSNSVNNLPLRPRVARILPSTNSLNIFSSSLYTSPPIHFCDCFLLDS